MEPKGRRVSRTAGPSAAPAKVEASAALSPEATTSLESPATQFAPSHAPTEKMVLPTASIPPATLGAIGGAAKSASPDELADFGRETFTALVQSQAALARGLEAFSVEMTGLALSGIDAVARTATDMLAVTTLSDAIEVNAGFTRSSFDTLVNGSAKLSELGVRLATEASQPILTQLGRGWINVVRLAF